ncbi:hypothetical protein ACH4Q7_22670 [Streptomyces roseolus]|uniref:hypothetical protein n=1 Tax=Streptomyces roseolus TaxID=67358 RepID=UPI0037B339A0
MTNQDPTTQTTTPEDEVYTPYVPAFVSDQPMEISGQDMGYLIAWMKTQLTAQEKHLNNSDLCQALSAILRQAHDLYGTEDGTRETCICYG